MAQDHSGTSTVAVVAVNYRSHELLELNLGPLLNAAREADDHQDVAVRAVVVDNFSSSQERTAVREMAARLGVDLLEMDNRGFGAGMNAGFRFAAEIGADTVLMLNPDAVIDRDTLVALHRACLDRPRALISPRVVDSAGKVVFAGSSLYLASGRIRGRGSRRPVSAADNREESVPWLTAACLAANTAFVAEIGGFDEGYFMYWEDVDLSDRARAAGGELILRDDLQVVHDEGGTQQAGTGAAKSSLYYRYNTRNRLVYAARRLSRRELLRWVALTPAVSWEILLRGGRRQLLQSAAPLWAALRGSVEGLAAAAPTLLRRSRAALRSAGQPCVIIAHPGAELYGSDRVVLESAAGLVEAGWRVVLAVPNGGPLCDAARSRGVEVVECATPVLRKRLLSPSGLLGLLPASVSGLVRSARLIRASQADVVVANTVTVPMWLLAARLLGRRSVCHVHEAEQSASPLLKRMLALPTLLADTVIANSAFSRDVLVDSAPRVAGRVTVVYNGVPGPETVSAPRVDLTGPVRLLFIGRLSPRKGPQIAIDAAALLTQRGHDVRLALLGSAFDGYDWFVRELHEQVDAHGLTSAVDFLGFAADVWPVLADADVVLVPSTVDEPFGNTAVEAVLAGRPLVVSRTSGLVEAARGYESAQSVDPGDPVACAEAVESVLADWGTFSRRALADAELAHERHDPARYRARVAELIAGGIRSVEPT